MSASHTPRPARYCIRTSANEPPWIAGYRCPECSAVATEQTLACRRCLHRNTPQEFRAAGQGQVYTWTVVQRSYPGVAVPFVSVIVDLDDGLTLKGTLCEADHGSLRSGLPVCLVFDDAGGAQDADGAPYIGYHFVPSTGVEQ